MSRMFLFTILCAALIAAAPAITTGRGPTPAFQELPFNAARIEGGFWGEKKQLLREVTLPTQWDQYQARHYLDNFRVAAGAMEGVHLGPVYLDSDLYKWLEAASCVSARHPGDAILAGRIEEVTALIEAAQMPDGYLNTYYQSIAPDRRWTNLMMNHELYCAGHLIEAACARHESGGDDRLLGVARRLANHIVSVFGPGRNQGMPGHEEIELSLIRLYRATGNREYLDMADFFITRRGTSRSHTIELVADLRDQATLAKIAKEKRAPFLEPGDKGAASTLGSIQIPLPSVLRSLASFYNGKYFQVHEPLMKQIVAEGHAVRAMYFYAGAGDLCLETGREPLLEVLERIWDNTITKRTYLTGGMGSVPIIEGFGRDYELPNKSYTETCAAIGSFLFSWRMLKATGDARYADQMERTLYNAIIGGLSLDGRHYFYQNPLTSRRDIERREWYLTACCPPNIARLLGSLEKYLYGASEDAVWFHQYVSGSLKVRRPEGPVVLKVESGLPWSGKVEIRLSMKAPASFTLKLRAPVWSETSSITVNGQSTEAGTGPDGYLALSRSWRDGDRVELDLEMAPRLVEADPRVKADRNRAAIMRGPLVYCLEEWDNAGLDVHEVKLGTDPQLDDIYAVELLGGVMKVRGMTADGRGFEAVPYYAWNNRGPSHMEVWINR